MVPFLCEIDIIDINYMNSLTGAILRDMTDYMNIYRIPPFSRAQCDRISRTNKKLYELDYIEMCVVLLQME